MDLLKLVALDREDLEILSSHLQDAVLPMSDMIYLPSKNRFIAIVNRFEWCQALTEEEAEEGRGEKKYQRRQTALRFDRVLAAQTQALSETSKGGILNLLALQFEEKDLPGGYIRLIFSGGGAVRLHVECIEGELKDMGAAWQTTRKPSHEESNE